MAFRTILVPTDFSPCSERALEVALELAKAFDSSVTLIHVWEFPVFAYTGAVPTAVDFLTPIEQAASARLEETLAAVKPRCKEAKSILKMGVPWHELIGVIEETRPDLVVMGTHGRHGLNRALLGSVAEKLVRLSPVPVLTVRHPEA